MPKRKPTKVKRPQKARYLERALMFSKVWYCLVLSEREYHAELRRLKIARGDGGPFLPDGHHGAEVTWISFEGRICGIVKIDPAHCLKLLPCQVYAMLVHEAVHLWQRHAKEIGSDNAGEEEAYAIQRYAQALIHEFDRRVRRR